MPWFYVDDGFSDSKPVENLPDHMVKAPLRLAACGLWVLAGSWSAKEETDGFVPETKLRALHATPTLVRALTEPGPLGAPLWDHVSGHDSGPDRVGIQFRSWSKWQKTRAELQARREAEAEKKRDQRKKGRNAVASVNGKVSPRDTSGDNDGDKTGDTSGDNGQLSPRDDPGDSHARARRPDPTRPFVETLGGGGHVTNGASLADQPPPKVCPEHWPDGTREPCADCAGFRKSHEAWLATHEDALRQAAREEREAERAASALAIASCELCDDDGYRNGAICHHNPDQLETNRRGVELVRAAMRGEAELPPADDEDDQ